MNIKTNVEMSRPEIDDIRFLMRDQYQLDLTVFNDGFLGRSLERRRVDLGIPDRADYRNYLIANEAEAKTLFASLTITYTQFFRDPVTFAVLEQAVLPTLLAQKKAGSDFRVWCAGCSTGQEAYSLAILLADTVSTQGKQARVRIFATDKNEQALSEAKKGVYDAEAVQNLRLKQVIGHFAKTGDGYAVDPAIKQLISFSQYDLLDPASSYPPECIYGDFDLVICSNLLIYYTPDRQRFIVDKLVKSLSSAGVLVTGEAERGLMEGLSGLPILVPQIPIFKRSSLDHATQPIWRNRL